MGSTARPDRKEGRYRDRRETKKLKGIDKEMQKIPQPEFDTIQDAHRGVKLK
jgi:hypothetical protein